MNRGIATTEEWHPQTQQDRDAVIRELQKILTSPHFCNSKRYPALLKYIVENTLAGKADLLKERTLGVEVFERPATYDTNADTVVRYTAGEVRKRLMLYYHEGGSESNLRISLPTGSYVPEFLHGADKGDEAVARARSDATLDLNGEGFAEPAGGLPELPLAQRRAGSKALVWTLVAIIVILIVVVGFMWRARTAHPRTIADDFWAPVLRDQRTAVICTGGVLFAQNKYSGVITMGTSEDAQYPFVSMQIAAAIAQVEEALDNSGIKTQLISAPWSTLTDLREHSVTLLGAYNNQWTMRLIEPLRYRFTPNPEQRIVDGLHPQTGWERDESVPYSSADDFALVARFRDPITDGWVMALAGLGRNGTEAAAQFATSPHYLGLLQQQLGRKFGDRNIEVVLKVSVVEAKTGAPSIVAVYTW